MACKRPKDKKYHHIKTLKDALFMGNYPLAESLLGEHPEEFEDKSGKISRLFYFNALSGNSSDCLRLIFENFEVDLKKINPFKTQRDFRIACADGFLQNEENTKKMIDTLAMAIKTGDHESYGFSYILYELIRQNKYEMAKYFIEKSNVKMKKVIFMESEIFISIIHRIDYSESFEVGMLNYLFGSIYGNSPEEYCTKYNFNDLLCFIYSREKYVKWFLDKFYNNEQNKFKEIFVCAQTHVDISDIYKNKVLLIFHSFIKEIALRKHFRVYFNVSYPLNPLVEIYETDKNLFNVIAKLIRELKLRLKSLRMNIDIANFLYLELFLENKYSESQLIEIFDKVGLERWGIQLPSWARINIRGLRSLMPFLAVTSANYVYPYAKHIRKLMIQKAVPELCTQAHNTKVLSLANSCRIVIRRTVFMARKNYPNFVRIQKLRSLELPSPLLNFLFFNDSNYNMFPQNK